MTMAERIFWFKYDNNDIAKDQLPQIEAQMNNADFLEEIEHYLLDIIVGCNRRLKEIGEPYEGFEQIVYDDLIFLHDKAVDIFNELMEYQNA